MLLYCLFQEMTAMTLFQEVVTTLLWLPCNHAFVSGFYGQLSTFIFCFCDTLPPPTAYLPDRFPIWKIAYPQAIKY